MTISEFKRHFKKELSDLYTDSETDFLYSIFAEKLLDLNQIQLRMMSENDLSDEDESKFQEIISELKTGKPYQHILGETEFYGMTFFVNENVLIPRPETEELLEIAISKIQNSDLNSKGLKILDIGTGSGVIPLVLKKYFPNSEISSIDFSEKALEVAKRNAEFHQLDVKFIHSDYLNLDLTENYDIIISNPPYIGIEEEVEIKDSVKGFEPNMALFSPTSDALIFYRKIAKDAEKYLNKNGLLFLEINQKLGQETLELYENTFSKAELIKDLSENDRFIFAIK
ncbi:peptide chain release factor N(5)-glutamine methyltransferase [Chryseobacterium wangxinyae]|uniref:peptide chain release factor N(5)-glutamine methyltransferase n=1 Tax=Chryseobacterium sp. CY350 TaxID=2997336 RepID=UPI00226DBA1E|nr:peptide chain release factor N(5)-glutamine methyltransferase [Chryseobacterium sp. CY350]MCY0978646.1 peptide chain release factor N(5)-glutamine methyltransferase [Chryseobacterium sp. CY350]WBZ96415.1 peptide chain release factor N(5)-glutamine methyltransferase [Chryseobacterium sp. CY350]